MLSCVFFNKNIDTEKYIYKRLTYNKEKYIKSFISEDSFQLLQVRRLIQLTSFGAVTCGGWRSRTGTRIKVTQLFS